MPLPGYPACELTGRIRELEVQHSRVQRGSICARWCREELGTTGSIIAATLACGIKIQNIKMHTVAAWVLYDVSACRNKHYW